MNNNNGNNKKLYLVDIANFEDMTIKSRKSINIYGFPIGIMSLATFIQEKLPIDIRSFDFGIDYLSEQELLDLIKEGRPDYVGIRAISANKSVLISIVNAIKAYDPTIFVIVGGPYVSEHNTDEYNVVGADCFVVGEGEQTLCELLDRLMKGEPYEDVIGLATRTGASLNDNNFHFVYGRRELMDINDIPFPDYDTINWEKYYQNYNWGYSKQRYAIMETTRGCPYSCTYCHIIFGKQTRYRTPDNIVTEMKKLIDKYGVTEFYFSDDIFNINTKRAIEIYDKIIKDKLNVRIHYPNGLRGDIMTEEYIDKMVEAGTVSVAYAVETPNLRLQKYMKKRVKLDKLEKVIEYTCDKAIMVRLFFMYGFPTETEEDVNFTLDYMKQYKNVVVPYFFAVKYYEDTEMYNQAIEEGFSRRALEESAKGLYTESEFLETPLLSKSFMEKAHLRWLTEVLLNKERMTNAVAIQKRFLTDDEISEFYSSFFNRKFKDVDDLLSMTR